MGLKSSLKHAFHVDPAGPVEPPPEAQELVDRFCREVARRRLSTPGLMALELARPLNFIGAQFMHVAQPAVWALAGPKSLDTYKHMSAFLERRGSIEYISQRIEHFESVVRREAKEAADASANEASEENGGHS